MAQPISDDSRRIDSASRCVFMVGIGIALYSLVGGFWGIDGLWGKPCCGEFMFIAFFTAMSIFLGHNRIYLYFALAVSMLATISFIGAAVYYWPPSTKYPANFFRHALLAIVFGLLSISIFSARKAVRISREDLRRGFEPVIPFVERLDAQDSGQAKIESTENDS